MVGSELPPIQILAFSVISWVLLGGFLLVDLGAPKFEAVLFSTLASCFSLISSFVDDLADPFGGSWTVDSAKGEVATLISAIKAKRAACPSRDAVGQSAGGWRRRDALS